MFFSLFKEKYRLISKEMSNISKKNWRFQNSNFLGKKIWRNALALKSKKVQCMFRETFVVALSSSPVFRLQN